MAKRPLLKPFSLVFSGNLFAAGLGFLAVLAVSRKLSVSDFGLFSIALSCIRTFPSLAALGLDTSMMRFASSYLGAKEAKKADQVMATTLYLRFASIALLSILIFFSARIISIKIFHAPGLASLLRIASFGIVFSTLLDYLKSVLWTRQQFKRSFFLQIGVDLAKLCAVLLFLRLDMLNSNIATAAFSLAPFLGVLVGLRWGSFPLILKNQLIPNLISKLFSYSKWIFLGDICRTLSPVIGLFLIGIIQNDKAAGIYGLAINLTYIFPILLVSLKAVLLPHVSRFNEKEEFKEYLKKSVSVTLLGGAGCLILLFFSRPIILFFFGARYSEAIPIFNLLLLAYLVFASQATIYTALYALNKQRMTGLLDLARLICILIGTYLSIRPLGLFGPPLVFLAINLAFLAISAFYVEGQLQKK